MASATTRTPVLRLTVERLHHGIRIDHFLRAHLRNHSTFRCGRLVASGAVSIDDVRAFPDQRVHRGETVTVHLLEPPDTLIDPDPVPLDILFEDPWLVGVNKPASVVAHQVANFQSETLTNGIQRHLDSQTGVRSILRPGVVHRLDRMTTGAMVITKDQVSNRFLSAQFEHRRTSKTYHAIVYGRLPQRAMRITVPIGQAAGGTSILRATGTDAKRPKPAISLVRELRRLGEASVVEVQPLTGRMHQIRVHLASVGCPVLGDKYYASTASDRLSRSLDLDGERDNSSRHLLHASRLTFWHPITFEAITLHAPWPGDFRHAIDRLG